MPTQPTREFGKRRPVAIPAPQPVKRSSHVALLLMGTFAVGGAAYALMPGENCGPRPGVASDQQTGTPCLTRGSSSAAGSWSSRRNFFSSDATPSAASSDPASGTVKRGGFGGFAQAFASHFSRGG